MLAVRAAYGLLSLIALAVWGSYALQVRSTPAAPDAEPPRSAAPDADSPAAEDPSYAQDSVFRPDVDRTAPPAFPPGSLLAAVRLTAPDAQPFSYFGHAVALDGETAVVGAPYDDGEGTDAGAAYVFARSGAGWARQARLTAPGARPFDRFGFSVAASGDRVAVGTDRREAAAEADAGAVYLWSRSERGWFLEATLAPASLRARDGLGLAVALEGDLLLAGAPGTSRGAPGGGAAYLFARRGERWEHLASLAPPGPADHAAFGYAVALAGDLALVGAPAAEGLAGAAFVFRRQGERWLLEARLAPADGAPLAKLGAAVALAGDLALVGAPRTPFGDRTRAGAAYLFRRRGGAWAMVARLASPSPRSDEEVGRSVALSASHALLGSNFGDALGLNTGVALVFERRGEAWPFLGPLLAAGGAAVDELGTAVALSGARMLVGAPRHAAEGNAAGAVFVIEPGDLLAAAAAPSAGRRERPPAKGGGP